MAGGGVMHTLLLVDDDAAQARIVAALAGRAGWRTVIVVDGARAVALVDAGVEPIDAVLIDAWQPAESGAALVAEMRDRWPGLPIVIAATQGSIELAIEAMRVGADDFLLKPFAADRLSAALDTAALAGTGEGELRPLAEKASEPLAFDEIVGSTPSLRTALAVAGKAARGRGGVLIEGAPGSGKELIARAIHGASARARRQPTVFHCSGLPPLVCESELFGHERGAFAGAFERSRGRIAAADGSTLILARVACLPAGAQAKLLAYLRSGQVVSVGGHEGHPVDTRIVAMSDRPLDEAVATGSFDPALAECLGTVTVRVPPLRARATDVPALARHLLSRIGRLPGLPSLGLTDEAVMLLASYSWPGNVRQLHDALFRAAVAARGAALTTADFPHIARVSDSVLAEAADLSLWTAAGIELYEPDGHIRPLDQIEADIIRLAIGHYEGRMSEVARRLGIGRSTLYRKLVELGLDTSG